MNISDTLDHNAVNIEYENDRSCITNEMYIGSTYVRCK